MTKHAYLTIDDFPSIDWQQKIDFLFSKQIPAVLFSEGRHLAARPEAALYALDRGFVLGNHTYTHPGFSQLTVDECIGEIKRCDDLLAGLYAQAGVTWTHKYFRFPYMDDGSGGDRWKMPIPNTEEGRARQNAIQTALRDMGYTPPTLKGVTYAYYHRMFDDMADWGVTFDCMEWSISQPEPMFGIDSLDAVLARIDEDEPEHGRGLNYPGSAEIVLIHDHHETTDIFTTIIERLLTKGLTFVPAT